MAASPEKSLKKLRRSDMGKYFGTAGFRGKVNVNLTAEQAYKIGRFLGWYYGQDKQAQVVIGKDCQNAFEYLGKPFENSRFMVVRKGLIQVIDAKKNILCYEINN